MGKYLYDYQYKGPSLFQGETWIGYIPGQDKAFPNKWVSRSKNGELHSCVNSKEDLIENAQLCEVILEWYKI